ncbi:MAG: urease accessory protein UreD [Paracoccaceae bacterium]
MQPVLPDRRTTPPRAVGTGYLRCKVRAESGASVLGDLRHSGCLKFLFPRGAADRLSAVLVNTSGGITGGDNLGVTATVDPSSRLTMTTQAAERIYRASGREPGTVSTVIDVGCGGRLDWLPQETILFDGAALDRRLRVNLDGKARCLLVETLVFGRTAMGERISNLTLSDRIEVWRDEAPLFIDRTRLSGDASTHLQRRAIGGGSVALASVLLVTPTGSDEAAAHLEQLRHNLPQKAGASLIRPDVLFLRLAAEDSFELRKTLLPLLAQLNDAPLPRTWMI